MAVIAMTREMGSQGRDVALALAEELGLEAVQHELVAHVADKLHVRESSVNRFLEGTASLLERWGIDQADLSLYTTEEILEVAARGNVLFRGWGATHVLRPVPHIPCIRVCASDETRVRVLMERVGFERESDARREIRHNDAAHARTMLHLFHVDWHDPTLYDLVLNTDRVSVAACVDTIKSLLARPEFQETDASRSRLKDMAIEAHIRTALRQNATTNRPTPSFEVDLEPGTGRVVLSGIVFDHEFSVAAEEIVMGVEGVREVENRLRAIGPASMGP